MLVSSAKSKVSAILTALGKSLMHNNNNNGPNIEPSGTPQCVVCFAIGKITLNPLQGYATETIML
jgi:hypothetical protein